MVLALYTTIGSAISSQRYLGVKMYDSQRADDDIIKELRGVYTHGNMLIKNFSKCSVHVKSQLFKSYFSSFYCSLLWYPYIVLNL